MVQGGGQIPALTMTEKEASLERFLEDKWLFENEQGFGIGVCCPQAPLPCAAPSLGSWGFYCAGNFAWGFGVLGMMLGPLPYHGCPAELRFGACWRSHMQVVVSLAS